jgi:hypothetical protein
MTAIRANAGYILAFETCTKFYLEVSKALIVGTFTPRHSILVFGNRYAPAHLISQAVANYALAVLNYVMSP